MPLIATATIGTPTLWAVTIGLVLVLVAVDFLLTRRPHEVSLREALAWSAFYVALPLAFGAWVWWQHGTDSGVEYLTGYLVEKSLSVDNLFVFMLLLGAFAVPPALRRRSTASPGTPTWSSPPTPSRCSACGRSTSCSRAP